MYSGWYIVIAILVSNFTLFILEFFGVFKKNKGTIIKNYKENGITWGDRNVWTYSETDISDWIFDKDDIPKCKKCGKEALYYKGTIYGSIIYAYKLSNYCPNCGAKMMDEESYRHKEAEERHKRRMHQSIIKTKYIGKIYGPK